jgi:hypothetical protein
MAAASPAWTSRTRRRIQRSAPGSWMSRRTVSLAASRDGAASTVVLAGKPGSKPQLHRPGPAPRERWRAIFSSRTGPHARRAGRVARRQAVGKFSTRAITAVGHRHDELDGGQDRAAGACGSRNSARADSWSLTNRRRCRALSTFFARS